MKNMKSNDTDDVIWWVVAGRCVAQRIGRPTRNREVSGSSPTQSAGHVTAAFGKLRLTPAMGSPKDGLQPAGQTGENNFQCMYFMYVYWRIKSATSLQIIIIISWRSYT